MEIFFENLRNLNLNHSRSFTIIAKKMPARVATELLVRSPGHLTALQLPGAPGLQEQSSSSNAGLREAKVFGYRAASMFFFYQLSAIYFTELTPTSWITAATCQQLAECEIFGKNRCTDGIQFSM